MNPPLSIKTELIQTWAEISDVHPLTVNVVPVDILAASTDPLQCHHDHRHMMSECQTITLTDLVPVVITFVFLLNILTVVVLQTEGSLAIKKLARKQEERSSPCVPPPRGLHSDQISRNVRKSPWSDSVGDRRATATTPWVWRA